MRAVERILVDVSNAWELETRPTLKIIGCYTPILRPTLAQIVAAQKAALTLVTSKHA